MLVAGGVLSLYLICHNHRCFKHTITCAYKMRLLKTPLCRPAQLRVALGARRPYVTGNSASSVDSPEPLRACGVPDTAAEAGPKEPSEILFPLMW